MALFTAYFDASGSSDDPDINILTVAGYIATAEAWERFEPEWQDVLDSAGISCLHMKHFSHSSGEFATWKGDEPRRANFLKDLSRVLGTHTEEVFAMSLRMDHYREIDRLYELRGFATPYPLAATLVIGNVDKWMKEKHPGDQYAFVFEKGDTGQDELIPMLARFGYDLPIEPTFVKKKWVDDSGTVRFCLPLQGGDFIAYEHAKNLTDLLHRGRVSARESFYSLLSATDSVGQKFPVLDIAFFKKACEAFRISPRK